MGAVFSTLLVIGAMQRCAAVDDDENVIYEVKLENLGEFENLGELENPGELENLGETKPPALQDLYPDLIPVVEPAVEKYKIKNQRHHMRFTVTKDSIPISSDSEIRFIRYEDQAISKMTPLSENPYDFITDAKEVYVKVYINGNAYNSNIVTISD